MLGYGSQGFESRLEVQKLSNILRNLEALRTSLEQGIEIILVRCLRELASCQLVWQVAVEQAPRVPV